MKHTPNTVHIFDRAADRYEEKFMDVSGYANSLDAFCARVPQPNARVLDLGCGPGNVSKYLLTKRPHFQLLGVDLSPKMIELARTNNPTAEFLVMDVRKIAELPTRFDAIVCAFCLPYLSPEETEQLVADAAKLLNREGALYISTMEGHPSKSGFTGSSNGSDGAAYTHYYLGDELCALLKKAGFTISVVTRQDFAVKGHEPAVDLIVIAQNSDAP